MTSYKNYSGISAVSAYEIQSDGIIVVFTDSKNYLYDSRSAGNLHIEKMKSLATAGRGLNSYINQNVRKLYAKKW